MKKAVLITISLLIALIVDSCSSTISTRNTSSSLVTITFRTDTMTASAEVRRATLWAKLKQVFADITLVPAARAAVPAAVETFTVTVTGTDMSAIVDSVDVSVSREASITVEVPNGLARNFAVDAYGSFSVLYYSGNTVADLTGDPITLTVGMTYVGALIYVANSADDSISVINAATETVIATIPVGNSPSGVVANPLTNSIYVANELSASVSVIDVASNTVVDTINTLVLSPTGLGVDVSINKVFVSNNFTSNSVDYIDVATRSVGTVIFGAAYGLGVAANPVTHKAYATDWGTLYVIDTLTNTLTGNAIAFPLVPPTTSWFGVAVNSATNRVYVTDASSLGQVFVVDGNTDTQIGVISVGTNPEGIAVNEADKVAYVANSGDGTVSVIDIAKNAVVTNITVGSTPRAVAVYAAARKVYVTNNLDGTVTVIDSSNNTVVNTIGVGGSPLGIAVTR